MRACSTIDGLPGYVDGESLWRRPDVGDEVGVVEINARVGDGDHNGVESSRGIPCLLGPNLPHPIQLSVGGIVRKKSAVGEVIRLNVDDICPSGELCEQG